MTIRGRIIRFWKYLKNLRTRFKILILILSISTIIIVGQLLILTRIYYKTYYKGDLSNFDYLVDKVETFDYIKNVKDQGRDYGYNLTKNSGHYIDRDFIEYLKKKIDDDFWEFHWWPFHTHYLHYTFNATEESQIFFTYNNNSVIAGRYDDFRVIFIAFGYDNIWEGKSFINFSQVPYVSEDDYDPFTEYSTISLNNTILIKMEIDYYYSRAPFGHLSCGTEQFIVLNSNYQIIFIYIFRSGFYRTI